MSNNKRSRSRERERKRKKRKNETNAEKEKRNTVYRDNEMYNIREAETAVEKLPTELLR